MTRLKLDPKVEKALVEIDFFKRYEELSGKFNEERTPMDERLIYAERDTVMDVVEQLGYSVKHFNKQESFYYTENEELGAYTFKTKFDLKYGMVELIWDVHEGKRVILGTPWGEFSRRMIDPTYIIRKPIFGTYEDLDEIFAVAYQMYEDFKKAMTNIE